MAPLRHSSFRRLVAGELVSNFGDAIYSVALSWYVLSHHGGVLLLGTVLAAYGVPRTALLIAGGHASDRYRPWTVMLIANAARGVAVAALALTVAIGLAGGWVLIVISVVLGAGEGMFVPASSAIVPALLPRDELQAGNALSFGTTQLSQLAGPAAGGVLVAFIGPASGFAIDAATFVVSALTLSGIQREAPQPVPAHDQREHPDPADAALTVWRLLAREPILRLILILITDALLNLGSAGMGRVALAALANGPLHLGAGGYGALSAALGGGLLLGTITGGLLPPARRPFLIASLVLLPTVPLIAAIPFTDGLIAAMSALIPAFALIAVGNLLLETGLQQWAPPQLIGRVTGLIMLASIGMFPVSVILAGVVIHLTGPAAYFPLSAGTVLIAATIQLSSPTWRRFDPDHPTSPANHT
jgi:MFS family permease